MTDEPMEEPKIWVVYTDKEDENRTNLSRQWGWSLGIQRREMVEVSQDKLEWTGPWDFDPESGATLGETKAEALATLEHIRQAILEDVS